MKIKIIGCFITLLMTVGQFSHATINTDGNIPIPSDSTSLNKTMETPRNPFSGEHNSSASLTLPAQSTISVTMTLDSGDLLSQGIKKWAQKSGYKLLWQSKNDYLIFSHIILQGKDDDEVLTALGKLFASENYGLIIKNYQKNRVLIVDDM